MPRGVSKDFIDLLKGDESSARTRTILLTTLGLLLTVPAFFLLQPWGAVIHLGAFLIMLGLGWYWGVRTTHDYEASMRGVWNQWMKLAPACDTVSELGRKVRGIRGGDRLYLAASGLTVLWAMELMLLVLAFMDLGSLAFSLPVIILNALITGTLAGRQMCMTRWTGSLRKSLDEMLQDGEIGVWGSMG